MRLTRTGAAQLAGVQLTATGTTLRRRGLPHDVQRRLLRRPAAAPPGLPVLALLLLRRLVPRRVDETSRRLRRMLTLWRLTPRPVRSVVHRFTTGRVGFVTGIVIGAIGSRAGTRLLRRRSRRNPALLAITSGAALVVLLVVAALYL